MEPNANPAEVPEPSVAPEFSAPSVTPEVEVMRGPEPVFTILDEMTTESEIPEGFAEGAADIAARNTVELDSALADLTDQVIDHGEGTVEADGLTLAVDYTPYQPAFELVEGVLGTVTPGDVGGLATFVVRQLGYGDTGVYDGAVVDHVRGLQYSEALSRQVIDDGEYSPEDASGIIAGATWALVLPEVTAFTMGEPRMFAERLLQLSNTQYAATEIERLIRDFQEQAGLESTGYIDKETWFVLLDKATEWAEWVKAVRTAPVAPPEIVTVAD